MYTVVNGKLMLDCNEIKQPAIIYDKTGGGLLIKHGEYAILNAIWTLQQAALQATPCDFSQDIVLLKIDAPVDATAEFLNEAISCTGAVNKQLKKLQSVCPPTND